MKFFIVWSDLQVDDNGRCTKVVLAEDKQGVDIHPSTRWVLRSIYKPAKPVTVHLFMTVYGKYPEQIGSVTIKVNPPLPEESIKETSPGVFELKPTIDDPKHARLFIDGQVYFFHYYLDGRTTGRDVNSAIVILVWDKFEVPTQPNWIRHVKPIFQQYANLYPVMKINFLDLSNYYEVVENKCALIKTMSLDEEDPSYMPVTRDLSPGKVQMILKWLMDDNPRYGFSNHGIGEYTLKYLLQTALQLEHSTIPPYLTGYLSIKKGYNTQVKSILKDILIDEMHHLAQVSNILNAIDGNPNLFAPHFVPSYPSYLPGGVHPDIKITVNKISMLQIRNVYMVLETPSKELEENGLIKAVDKIVKDTLKQVSVSETSTETDACDDVLTLYNDAVKKNEDIRTNHNTFGQLYTAILIVMAKLECDGKLEFKGTKPQLEVRGEGGKEVSTVHDFGTAVQAIKTIMKEGEGSSPCNPLDESSGLSHYYKFASIANKRHLKTIKSKVSSRIKIPFGDCEILLR
jgi:collagen type VI alpha